MALSPQYYFWQVYEKALESRWFFPGRGRHVFVACFPKSGSTWLTSVLTACTGFRFAMFVHRGDENEQYINEARLRMLGNVHTVTQQHAKGTARNVAVMKRYGIRPIILTRNIFDTLVSMRDHLVREGTLSSTGYVHQRYFDLSEEEQYLYLARVHAPWYFNFLFSWTEATCADIEAHWLTYEDLFADPVAGVAGILEFQGLSVDAARIASVIAGMDGARTRFNKGVAGRGQRLPASAKVALMDLARCWKADPEALARIGIDLGADGK